MRRILVILLLLLPLTSSAQLADFGIADSASITIAPAYPGPHEVVTASLNAYSIDTQGATIRWFVDGAAVTNAANERSIEVTTGAIGANLSVEAVVNLANGATLPIRTTITPSRVDLIVEADTSVPSWYEGRALPSPESTIRVTALPQFGDNTNAAAYSYLWRLDSKVLFGGSVRGKTVAEIKLPLGTNHTVTVDVLDQRGNIVSQGGLIIPVVSPEVYFYEDNPLRGASQIQLGENYVLVGEETTFRAEPFYIANNLLPNRRLIEWTVNRDAVDNPNVDPFTITLQNGGGLGLFQVGFHIRNLDSLLQGVQDSFSVQL